MNFWPDYYTFSGPSHLKKKFLQRTLLMLYPSFFFIFWPRSLCNLGPSVFSHQLISRVEKRGQLDLTWFENVHLRGIEWDQRQESIRSSSQHSNMGVNPQLFASPPSPQLPPTMYSSHPSRYSIQLISRINACSGYIQIGEEGYKNHTTLRWRSCKSTGNFWRE